MKRMGLIDGDVLAFRAAAATQQSFDWNGDGNVVEDADPKRAITVVRDLYESWRQAAGCYDCVIFQSDRRAPKTSFRYHVHPQYKAQRSGVKPVALLAVEKWLRDYRDATFYPGLEGDDALGIAATGEYRGGVVISTDKDMRTIPGYCFIIPHMKHMSTSRVERIDDDTALRNTAYQAIVGDSVDNYKGAPGVGPKRASGLLEGTPWSSCSYTDAVTAAFQYAWEKRRDKFVLDSWESEALMNWRCARILREGDYNRETGEIRLDNPWGPDAWINPF